MSSRGSSPRASPISPLPPRPDSGGGLFNKYTETEDLMTYETVAAPREALPWVVLGTSS